MKKSDHYKLYIILFAVYFISQGASQEASHFPSGDNCISCHMEEDFLPEDFQKYDVHLQAGLSCAGCHGGDSSTDIEEESMNPQKGFIGIPNQQDIPDLCGKCHSRIEFMRTFQPMISTDQVEQYYQSYHGKKLRRGDTNVANCTSCHSVHAILPAKDPRSTVYPKNVPSTCNQCHGEKEYMIGYQIPTNQFSQYEKSVHGTALFEKGDLSAPACNDCHGNHGAMPPGLTSISHVCGTCHINNMDYFLSSPMATAYEKKGFHACEECHGNHAVMKTSDKMIGSNEGSVCMECHKPNDKGYDASVEIKKLLVDAVAGYDSAMTKWKEVKKAGMDDEEIIFLVQESNQNIIQSRTLVHTFDPAKVEEKVSEAKMKAQSALKLGKEQLKEYDLRQFGLGGATFFITLLVIALFLKIREIEKVE